MTEAKLLSEEQRFRISTHDNGYYCVSIPNYYGGEVVTEEAYDALCATVKALRADVGKFSTLADERHDLLSAERRANDDLRVERAKILEALERAQQDRNSWRRTGEKLETEKQALQSQLAAVEAENKRLIDNASCELCDQSLYDTHGNQVQPPVCLQCFNNRVAAVERERDAEKKIAVALATVRAETREAVFEDVVAVVHQSVKNCAVFVFHSKQGMEFLLAALESARTGKVEG